MEELNGKAQDIHDNVVYIRGKISRLETSIDGLSNSVQRLSFAIESNNISNERIITRMSESLPIRFVCLICMIICLAFVGGGVLKEVVDSHVLLKLFGG